MDLESPLSEACPKCGVRMFNWPGDMTKCRKCLHEWYMDTSKQQSPHDPTLGPPPRPKVPGPKPVAIESGHSASGDEK